MRKGLDHQVGQQVVVHKVVQVLGRHLCHDTRKRGLSIIKQTNE